MAKFLPAAVLTAMLSAVTATPASASPFYYSAQITGTTVTYNSADDSYTTGSFAQANSDTSAPAQYGQTHTTWQVGANASSQDGGTSQSSIQLAPEPRVIGVSYARNLQAVSTVSYRITISGPANKALPVEIRASGTASWSQNGAADAFFGFSGSSPATTISKEVFENDPGQNREKGTETFKIDTILLLDTGASYGVTESTYAIADVRQFANFSDYANESAVVDPTFTVLGPDAGLYTIQGVPSSNAGGGTGGGTGAGSGGGTGGGTGTSVPEPASWLMMLAGVGVMATRLRRARPVIKARGAG